MKRQNSIKTDNLPFDVIKRIVLSGGRVHFIGVGGVSMYSLARLTLSLGAAVSGSDREESERTRSLSSLGANIIIGHNSENLRGSRLVVFSHAIDEEDPELIAARESNIPIANRAEYMGAMMLEYKGRIGVSGSHGKSTTVALLDAIFSRAMTNPTVLSGALLDNGEPYRLGSDGILIYEACEYRDSFLRFSPTVCIALNMELDHTDYFPDIESLRLSFLKALNRARDLAVISGDDQNLKKIKTKITTRTLTFGRGQENDYRYEITAFKGEKFKFNIYKFDNIIGSFSLNIPGVFNVHNAAAAIVTALEYGIDLETVRDAVSAFTGVRQRLEHLGDVRGRAVYYDYAHHPTEIGASIDAIRGLCRGQITLLFRPHTYSRTASLWDETCRALSLADYPLVCDIYPAREEPIPGVTAENLARDCGGVYLSDENAAEYVLRNTRGTIVLMGAGDLTEIKNQLMR